MTIDKDIINATKRLPPLFLVSMSISWNAIIAKFILVSPPLLAPLGLLKRREEVNSLVKCNHDMTPWTINMPQNLTLAVSKIDVRPKSCECKVLGLQLSSHAKAACCCCLTIEISACCFFWIGFPRIITRYNNFVFKSIVEKKITTWIGIHQCGFINLLNLDAKVASKMHEMGI